MEFEFDEHKSRSKKSKHGIVVSKRRRCGPTTGSSKPGGAFRNTTRMRIATTAEAPAAATNDGVQPAVASSAASGIELSS